MDGRTMPSMRQIVIATRDAAYRASPFSSIAQSATAHPVPTPVPPPEVLYAERIADQRLQGQNQELSCYADSLRMLCSRRSSGMIGCKMKTDQSGRHTVVCIGEH